MRLILCLSLLSIAANVSAQDAPKHWSLRPRSQSPVPRMVDATGQAWIRSPIDAFVLARLRQEQLQPAPQADRRTLIRRVYFDLLGLPPTPEEVAAFVIDPAPDAYERLVDRLLASPHYGERWARRWLDVVRFAETEGFEYDRHRPGAWRFRDYVIDAANRDKPFDRFVFEQLAGDEIEPETPELQVAAGFHRLGPVRRNAGNQELAFSRHEVLTEMTDIVGTAFLALTVGCARCHDHKFDDISQDDYYGLQAFMALAQERDVAPNLSTVRNMESQRTPIHLLKRGNTDKKGRQVGPHLLTALSGNRKSAWPAETAHPRTLLARWIASPDHPLTARVIVNRLWQHHFGRGLVATANDFGVNGSPPSHPELLDWLANTLVANGWHLKPLHRLIVLSSTYRQASRHPDPRPGIEKDSDNRLLWHFPRRRLEAEEIRDAMLQISGRLNLKAGGPSVMVPVDPDLANLLYAPNQWTVTSDRREHDRRSIYLIVKRNLRLPFMEAFDQPDALTSCAMRESSTHALQALELLNGRLGNDLAESLARRLQREAGADTARQVDLAYHLVASRAPTSKELALAMDFLKHRSAKEFALAMVNLNGFLYVE